MTLQADSAAAPPPLPPPDSAATNGISPTAEETSQPPRPTPPPELRVPIWWPEDGTLSMDWVENLMRCFDWCSRNVPPSELPSVLPVEVFDSLILVASKMLHKEPNCVPVDPFRPTLDDNSTPSDSAAAASVVVVGDVHGQLHDLLFLLRDAGFPSRDRIFVFNGDYVDRGAWGLETFLLLLAWKVNRCCTLTFFFPKCLFGGGKVIFSLDLVQKCFSCVGFYVLTVQMVKCAILCFRVCRVPRGISLWLPYLWFS